eukprot:scaffold7968_cov240-Ochromonas_danica.AAC.5
MSSSSNCSENTITSQSLVFRVSSHHCATRRIGPAQSAQLAGWLCSANAQLLSQCSLTQEQAAATEYKLTTSRLCMNKVQ